MATTNPESQVINSFVIGYIFYLRRQIIQIRYRGSYYLLEFEDILDLYGNSDDIFHWI